MMTVSIWRAPRTLAACLAFPVLAHASLPSLANADTAETGQVLAGLHGELTWLASDSAAGFVAVAGLNLRAVAPASVMEANHGYLSELSAPLASVSGRAVEGGVEMTQYQAAGGMFMQWSLPTSGRSGSMSMTGLRVDLDSRAVHVDLAGDRGVGPLSDVRLWTFSEVVGERVLALAACAARATATCDSLAPQTLLLKQLVFTSEGADAFVSVLGLSVGARAALTQAGYFGDIRVSVVPEPASALMMLVGVLGLAGAARKARATTRATP